MQYRVPKLSVGIKLKWSHHPPYLIVDFHTTTFTADETHPMQIVKRLFKKLQPTRRAFTAVNWFGCAGSRRTALSLNEPPRPTDRNEFRQVRVLDTGHSKKMSAADPLDPRRQGCSPGRRRGTI